MTLRPNMTLDRPSTQDPGRCQMPIASGIVPLPNQAVMMAAVAHVVLCDACSLRVRQPHDLRNSMGVHEFGEIKNLTVTKRHLVNELCVEGLSGWSMENIPLAMAVRSVPIYVDAYRLEARKIPFPAEEFYHSLDCNSAIDWARKVAEPAVPNNTKRTIGMKADASRFWVVALACAVKIVHRSFDMRSICHCTLLIYRHGC